MVTSGMSLAKYGAPEKENNLVLWDVPPHLEIGVIPKKLYCNKDLLTPLTQAFKNLIETGCVAELRTWDGCFNIRDKKGGKTPSLHSWALAVDVNSAWNRFGHKPTLSDQFVHCFTSSEFDWGGVWGIPDGMHFQISKLPA